MEKIYSKYLTVRKLGELCNELPQRDSYELHNILERLLITSYPNLISAEAEVMLKKELHQKHLDKMYVKIMEIIKLPIVGLSNKLRVEFLMPNVTFKYGQFEKTISKYRYDILSRRFSYDELNQDVFEEELNKNILECMLEYEALLPGSQQWAIPFFEYRKMVEDEGATIEGFASPFNSQIIRIDPSLNFCSLVPSDRNFGSLGNFFDQDFTGKTATVNPPFIESILEAAARKCIDQLEQKDEAKNKEEKNKVGKKEEDKNKEDKNKEDKNKVGNPKSKFIFYGPEWTDSKFYELLNNSKYKKTRRDLRKFTYEYEDLLTGKTIKAPFNSVVFTLTN